MDKKDFYKKLSAGIFFFLFIMLTVMMILVIGIEKGFTQPKFYVAVLFNRVDGLAIGAPIRFSGVSVGTVGKIDFLEEKINGRGVKVTLNIFKRYKKQLEKSTRISIRTEGLLGGKLVDISSSEVGPYVDLDWPIIGEDPIDVQDLVVVFKEAANSFTQTTKTMDSINREVRTISESSQRLIKRVEQKLIEGNLFKVF